jgi:hypothetical protein
MIFNQKKENENNIFTRILSENDKDKIIFNESEFKKNEVRILDCHFY